MSDSFLLPRPAFIPCFAQFHKFKNTRIGLTGHRGLLGTILTERLSRHHIFWEAFPGDITDASALEEWFSTRRFDFFFHLAARVSVPMVDQAPVAAFETNAVGAFNVCSQILKTCPQSWFFLASSSHVYQTRRQPLRVGDSEAPSTFYGASKLAAEKLVMPLFEKCGGSACAGRIFSFTHSTQKSPYLVPALQEKIGRLQEGDTLEVTNALSMRDIMDAEVVIDAILHLAARRWKGVTNIASGIGITVGDVAERVARRQGKAVKIAVRQESPPDALVADVSTLRSLLSGPDCFQSQ